MKKLENLIHFDDFNSSWKEEKSQKTKRTETGLDILKENIEEIIPDGLPEDRFIPIEDESNFDKIAKIETFITELDDEGVIDEIVNNLRDVLLEMEQQGFIDDNYTDDLDDIHNGDWNSWITDVINLPDFPEEGLNNILEIIDIVDNNEFDSEEFQDTLDDVECPDCDGDGLYEDGEECEKCYGGGRVPK